MDPSWKLPAKEKSIRIFASIMLSIWDFNDSLSSFFLYCFFQCHPSMNTFFFPLSLFHCISMHQFKKEYLQTEFYNSRVLHLQNLLDHKKTKRPNPLKASLLLSVELAGWSIIPLNQSNLPNTPPSPCLPNAGR